MPENEADNPATPAPGPRTPPRCLLAGGSHGVPANSAPSCPALAWFLDELAPLAGLRHRLTPLEIRRAIERVAALAAPHGISIRAWGPDFDQSLDDLVDVIPVTSCLYHRRISDVVRPGIIMKEPFQVIRRRQVVLTSSQIGYGPHYPLPGVCPDLA